MTANDVNGAGVRQVVALKERIAIDVPSPKLRLRFTWARAHFLVIGQTGAALAPKVPEPAHPDEQGVLWGRIHLLPRHTEPGPRKRLARLLSTIRRQLTEQPRGGEISDTLARIEQLAAAAQVGGSLIDGDPLILPSARFALYRSGEFRLWIDETDLPDRIASIPVGLVGEARALAVADFKADFAEELGRHFYYVVRDLVHRHYHHHSSSDHILPISKAGPTNDYGWRRDTLHALARAALNARRRDDLLAYRNAEGLIAYADVVQGTLAKVRRSEHDYSTHEVNDRVTEYDWTHLRASIQSRAEEKLWRFGGRTQILAIMLSVALAVAALWFAIAQVTSPLHLVQQRQTVEWHIFRRLAAGLYARPLTAMMVAGLASGFAYEFFGRGLKSLSWFRTVLAIVRRPVLAIGVEMAHGLRRWWPQYADGVSAFVLGLTNLAIGVLLIFALVRLLGIF